MSGPKGRAETPEQKRAVMERVLKCWLRAPEQRLGQLLDNTVVSAALGDLFSIEDDGLVSGVERLITAWGWS